MPLYPWLYMAFKSETGRYANTWYNAFYFQIRAVRSISRFVWCSLNSLEYIIGKCLVKCFMDVGDMLYVWYVKNYEFFRVNQPLTWEYFKGVWADERCTKSSLWLIHYYYLKTFHLLLASRNIFSKCLITCNWWAGQLPWWNQQRRLSPQGRSLLWFINDICMFMLTHNLSQADVCYDLVKLHIFFTISTLKDRQSRLGGKL